MKKFKRILSVMLSGVMAATIGVAGAISAYAADPTYSITINPTEDGIDHTYEAYQIFKGDYLAGASATDVGKLSNIKWGDDVDSTPLLTAIKASDDFNVTDAAGTTKNLFASASTAEDVALVMKESTFTDEMMVKFAAIVADNLTDTGKSGEKDTEGNYIIDELNPGYYLVKDTTSASDLASASRSRYIVQVLGDVTVDPKVVLPGIDKYIANGTTNGTKTNTACIGDVIPFVITSEVPDMTGYTSYTFEITDILSKGLTYNENMVISIGDTTLEAGNTKDYVVSSTTTTDGTELVITFNNFIEKQSKAGESIVIKYAATVNAEADLTMNGNTNTATLTYSNDPTNTSSKGNTPPDTTTTYVAEIVIKKVDSEDNTKVLEGASFLLNGSNISVIQGTDDNYYEPVDSVATGVTAYYQLKTGEFTSTAPTTSTLSLYVSEQKYIQHPSTEALDAVKTFQVSGTDGLVTYTGLSAGTYTISEVKAPEGYNLLKNDISVELACDGTKWTATVTEGTATITPSIEDGTGIITFEVANSEGTVLPVTGGNGTKLLYILGTLLVTGSAVLFVTKKRMALAK